MCTFFFLLKWVSKLHNIRKHSLHPCVHTVLVFERGHLNPAILWVRGCPLTPTLRAILCGCLKEGTQFSRDSEPRTSHSYIFFLRAPKPREILREDHSPLYWSFLKKKKKKKKKKKEATQTSRDSVAGTTHSLILYFFFKRVPNSRDVLRQGLPEHTYYTGPFFKDGTLTSW